MSDVFVDTVGVVALINRNDQWHAAARDGFAKLKVDRNRLFTTSLVMAEAGNAFARTGLRGAVTLFRDELFGQGRIVFPSEIDWRLAWRA